MNVARTCTIDENATVGYEQDPDAEPTTIGANGTVGSGTIIYCDVAIGDDLATGHDALVREEWIVGDEGMPQTKITSSDHAGIATNTECGGNHVF